LAPDIFAGVGSSAGPGLGTSSSQYSSVPWNYSDQDKASLCNNISGNYASNLSTQIYSTIHGSSDPTVAPEFNDHGANIMSLVYGASTQGQSTTIATGGTKTVYSDNVGPRVSKISVSGMGHDWSSENGGNSGYFINNKVDYPNYITQWFFDNNRRINDGDNLIDADGDGYSEISDCNDLDVSINPGTEDVCGDGIDQSCSGSDSICSSWVCREYTSYNTYHYNASPKRATYWYYNFQYHYYAKGSGEELAFTGPYSVTTVSEASLGYFEKGACL
jgi:poly(3-hydroxybutyrate) depolymerase